MVNLYKISLKRVFFLPFLILLSGFLSAQVTIKGVVRDLETKEPLIGAFVVAAQDKGVIENDPLSLGGAGHNNQGKERGSVAFGQAHQFFLIWVIFYPPIGARCKSGLQGSRAVQLPV